MAASLTDSLLAAIPDLLLFTPRAAGCWRGRSQEGSAPRSLTASCVLGVAHDSAPPEARQSLVHVAVVWRPVRVARPGEAPPRPARPRAVMWPSGSMSYVGSTWSSSK